ncbi:hypothetical protein VSK91_09165 [Bacillus swezeyi]|uniref:hypothetical protein n=1 Tax=Bacillus swezeyi TaxID=1925020 RepID=UPI0039C5E12B
MSTLSIRVFKYKSLFLTLSIALVSLVAVYSLFHGVGVFHAHRVVPWISVGAFALGFQRARKAWRAGKSVRTALRLVAAWSVVSLLLSVIGDATIEWLLAHDINKLANW